MPKAKIDIPPETVSVDTEAKQFVSKWKLSKPKWAFEKRKMGDDDLIWMMKCARDPHLVDVPAGMLMEGWIGDGMEPTARAARLGRLILNHSEEAAEFWQAARQYYYKQYFSGTKLTKARQAIRAFTDMVSIARDGLVNQINPQKLKARYWREDLPAIVKLLVKGGGTWQAKDVESYLMKRYRDQDWSATVEDAIQAERGKASGKKSHGKPE